MTKPLATALRQARLDAGVSQADVAIALGWASGATLSSYENDHAKVTPGVVERVLDAIDRIKGGDVPPVTAHRIKTIRYAAGLSLAEVSAAVGFARGRLATYESGRVRVTPAIERRVIDAIGRAAAAKREAT